MEQIITINATVNLSIVAPGSYEAPKKSKMFINLLALEMVQKFHLFELSLQFKIDWMPKWTTESTSSDVAVLMPMERTN